MKSIHHLLLLLAIPVMASVATASEIFTAEEIAATVDIREIEAKPQPIDQQQPLVTPELRNQTGRVYVAFLVSETGEVTGLRCVKSTNNRLNSAVMDAVARWKFEPAKVDGTPVPVRVVLPIRVDFT